LNTITTACSTACIRHIRLNAMA